MEKKNTEYLGVEGYELMGAAFEVHGELNGGLAEDEVREHVDGAPQVCPQRSGGLRTRVPSGQRSNRFIRKAWSGSWVCVKYRFKRRRT